MYNDYFVPFPTIISKRVTLRRVRMSDKEPLFKMCSDLSSCEFSDWYPHVDRGDTAVFIRYLNKKYRKKELFSFGITLTENDRLIGTISIASINSAYTVAEIGYTLDADYRGLG
ncbi:MAG: GNAT family N-acetyltransferase, partial [Oscillospiraceae bacterium]|nr:GNAT family N-acetyltransferase [Candidatus Equicaccousia limihippi]